MKSGKYDYYVRYDTPIPTTPLTEIIATGWDDCHSSDDECSPGRVVVKVVETTSDDSESDSTLIYPEPISIQQRYPEESEEVAPRRPVYYKRGLYWHRDDSSTSSEYDAEEVEEGASESTPEWLNPFYTPPEIISPLTEAKPSNLEYPMFHKFKGAMDQLVFPSTAPCGAYNPPEETMVGPPVYPPASGTSSYTPGASYPPIRRNFQGGFGKPLLLYLLDDRLKIGLQNGSYYCCCLEGVGLMHNTKGIISISKV